MEVTETMAAAMRMILFMVVSDLWFVVVIPGIPGWWTGNRPHTTRRLRHRSGAQSGRLVEEDHPRPTSHSEPDEKSPPESETIFPAGISDSPHRRDIGFRAESTGSQQAMSDWGYPA
jgi:hypothetical protein